MDAAAHWAEETEARLLDAALREAPRLGWNSRLVRAAGRAVGLSPAECDLLLPHGARDLASLLARRHDRRGLDALAGVDPTALKVRERIRRAVIARGDVAWEDEAALRRWAGFLSLPTNAALGLRLAWASADGLWRWAGDAATDENHYTKRALLAEILVSTLAIRLAAGARAAEDHLDARIASVMAFERWKAGVAPARAFERAAETLGRWRYGAVQPPPASPS